MMFVVLTEHLGSVYKVYQRFLGFSVVGGLVLCLGLAVMAFLIYFGVDEKMAYFVQAVICIETNFLLNKKFNWVDRKGSLSGQWIKFHLARGLTFLLNQLLFILFNSIGAHWLVATLIGSGFTSGWNYFWNDRFVFKAKREIEANGSNVSDSNSTDL